MTRYDVVVVGAGPAGSSAAWRAATSGARVLLVDKARFPRDKPCGDGLTPRAVRSISDIGLANELKAFHRVDILRVHGANRVLEFGWPSSEGFPSYGYVAPRTDLDDLLLRHAQAAGAEVWEHTSVRGPIVEDGLVRGVRVRRDGTEAEVQASAVVAADGASSPLARSLGMVRDPQGPMGIAIRAHFPSLRPDDNAIESYLEIRDELDRTLPSYGWVFPMGGGRINVGTGLLTTYKGWREVNTSRMMDHLLAALPSEWEVPSLGDLRSGGDLKGWRLPMALSVRPPWVPGCVAAGDAAGVVNPFNGEGISEAVESGVAGAEAILQRLTRGGPEDLSLYERRLDDLWGPYYRLGRTFARLIGKPGLMRLAIDAGMRIPPLMSFAFKVLANLYREEGGTAGDATARGMVRLASVVRLG